MSMFTHRVPRVGAGVKKRDGCTPPETSPVCPIDRNICIVGPFPEDEECIRGGVQAAVYGKAKAWKSCGGSVRVISLPVETSSRFKAETRQRDGIKVTYLHTRICLAATLFHLPLMLRYALNPAFNRVHVHGTGLAQTILLSVLRLKGIRHICILHGITEKETRQKYLAHKTPANFARYVLYTLMERFSVRIARYVMVDTPYVAKTIGRKKNISAVPGGGIFSEEFTHMHSRSDTLPVILSIGVLKPRKGHHKTIEAFARIKERIPEASLIIAGASPDIGYLSMLEEQVLRLGLAASIHFRISVPRTEIIKLLAEAKIFALHSEEESQGIALCEAMAAGLPVVATQVGGIPFVVQDRKDGLLVPYGDIAGFADAIVTLLNDNELYEKMSHSARISGQRFDWKNLTGEIIAMYSKIP